MLRIGRKKIRTEMDEAELQLAEDIRRAKREREAAQNLFENAVDLDRIDHAIYTLEAAEKRLDILLREAKGLWGRSGEGANPKRRIIL
ncbi:DUF2508 family protein [Cohnella sp. AR92]|uniref:DUF2508 family protein n=1 Tax=Cohnella sp. AR92 TaxID=648716 RepID=UPI0013154402|nr:DUF2508 family protein [Cohnella sp. AR92]